MIYVIGNTGFAKTLINIINYEKSPILIHNDYIIKDTKELSFQYVDKVVTDNFYETIPFNKMSCIPGIDNDSDFMMHGSINYTFRKKNQDLYDEWNFLSFISESAKCYNLDELSLEKGIQIMPNAIICDNCELQNGVYIGFSTIIKKNVKIGEFAVIGDNVIIEENCVIPDNCFVESGKIIHRVQ